MNSIKRYFVLFVLAGTGCTLVFNLYLEYSQYVTSTARLESNSNSIKKVSLTRWQQQGTNSDGDSGTQQPTRGSKSALVQDSSNDSSNSTGKQQAASSFPLVMKDEKHILPGGRWSANMNLNPWHYIQSGRRPDLAPKLKGNFRIIILPGIRTCRYVYSIE